MGRSRKKTNARRNSRQRDQTPCSSSEEECERSLTRADMKRRRRKPKESTESVTQLPPAPAAAGMTKSFNSTLSQTKKDADIKRGQKPIPNTSSADVTPADGMLISVVVQHEDDIPLNKIEGKLNRLTSPDRSQIVLDSKSTHTSKLTEDVNKENNKKINESEISNRSSTVKISQTNPTLTKSNDSGSLDDFVDIDDQVTDASSIPEDESQYSAIVHFKPNKPANKRILPVPGMWKLSDADEFISKNKKLIRAPFEEAITEVWTIKVYESANKKLTAPETVMSKDVEKLNKTLSKKDGAKKSAKNSVMTLEDQKSTKKTSTLRGILSAKSKPVEKNVNDKSISRAVIDEEKRRTDESGKVNLVESKIENKIGPAGKSQLKTVMEKILKTEPKTTASKTTKSETKPMVMKEERIQVSAIMRSKAIRAEEAITIRSIPHRPIQSDKNEVLTKREVPINNKIDRANLRPVSNTSEVSCFGYGNGRSNCKRNEQSIEKWFSSFSIQGEFEQI
ncbi:hypothetical protein DICVIV_02666 [Dictyocaulus viviparus]|uniref:Uncharacterized protein n=1 Tax=Dictyocaulus viviparus TaxID=29172 RepID=A0A0D8Y2Y1_DICVI|nr:hypothetical protein DICVIV_02666 [Dictyocaulus viviparus]